MDAFYSTQTSSLNFRQKWMEQHFQRFRKQRTTSRGIPKFSKSFFPEGFFPFTLLSEFLEFSVEWFAFDFRNFWKLFPAIPVPFTPVFKFLKVLVEWKAPNISKVLPFIGKPENILPKWTVPFASPLAFELSRFFLLLGANDVSPVGTSATQRKEFHIDDVQSVRNLVRSSDWSTYSSSYIFFTCCLRMTEKRPQRSNVNVMNLLQNSQYS